MYSFSFFPEVSEDECPGLAFSIHTDRPDANKRCQLGKLENLYFLCNFFLLTF